MFQLFELRNIPGIVRKTHPHYFPIINPKSHRTNPSISPGKTMPSFLAKLHTEKNYSIQSNAKLLTFQYASINFLSPLLGQMIPLSGKSPAPDR